MYQIKIPLFSFLVKLILVLFFPFVILIAKFKKIIFFNGNKEILLTHFGAIGDTLICIPYVHLLKKKLPRYKINFLTSDRGAYQILKRKKDIDNVIFFQQYKNGNVKSRFNREGNRLINQIKLFYLYPIYVLKIIFSRIVIGASLGPFHEAGTFSNLLFDISGIKISIGCFGNFKNSLSKTVKENVLDEHWNQIYMRIIESVLNELKISLEDDFEKLNKKKSFEITYDEKKTIINNIYSKGLKKPFMISVIHPGGATYVNSKLWGIDKFAVIADYLYEKYNMNIFITGSSSEKYLAKSVSYKMKNPCYIVAGEYDIPMVASLLDLTTICITNDTSILHLANVMETKYILSIWGPTNPMKIGEKNDRNYFIKSPIECSPCITLDAGDIKKKCDREIKEECLKIIEPEKVRNVIDKIFSNLE